MIKILNFSIVMLICLIPITLLYVIHALAKNKQKKLVGRGILLFIGITILLVFFYFPIKMKLPDPKQLTIYMDDGNRLRKVEDMELVKEIKEYVEKQSVVRSTTKTLFRLPSYPAKKGIYFLISGNDTPFYLYVFARKDDNSQSFVSTGKQYYSVRNTDKFVNDIKELLESRN